MTAREPELDIDEPAHDEPFGEPGDCNPRHGWSHICTLPLGHGGPCECGDCGMHDETCDCIDCVTRAGERQDEAVREQWGDLAQRRA